LGVTEDNIIPTSLRVYVPATWTGENPSQLLTLWEGFLKSDLVPTLQSYIISKRSPFYTNQPTPLLQTLVAQVDGSYPLSGGLAGSANAGGTAASDNSAADGGSDNSRRNAIIGVCSAIGGALLIALLWWFFKHLQRTREQGHHRMSMYTGGPAPTMGLMNAAEAQNPFSDYGAVGVDQRGRRNSFFFAEDSLRGFEAPREAQDETEGTFHRMSPDMAQRQRAPIVPSHISAPILRESSLNW